MKTAGELRDKYKFLHTESEDVMTDKGHREYDKFAFLSNLFKHISSQTLLI